MDARHGMGKGIRRWSVLFVMILSLASRQSFGVEVGGKPEKTNVVVTYAQPSGAFTPIWVAYEAGLFKKYGF